jgi:hypothetical protein
MVREYFRTEKRIEVGHSALTSRSQPADMSGHGHARFGESEAGIRRDRREIDPETTTAPQSPNWRAAKSNGALGSTYNSSPKAIRRPRVSSENANSHVEKSCLVPACGPHGTEDDDR